MSHEEEQKEYLTVANEALMAKVAQQDIIINAFFGNNKILVEAIKQTSDRLKDMINWSDRIGSDEQNELENIIHSLNSKL